MTSEWRDISTAPKDGTRILLLLANGEIFSGFGTISNGFFRHHADGSDVGWLNPSHWMPLPDAPVSA